MKEKSAEAKVEALLVTGILNGKYPALSRLKPERELADAFGYSRSVVHKAIIRLESKGLLYSKAFIWMPILMPNVDLLAVGRSNV